MDTNNKDNKSRELSEEEKQLQIHHLIVDNLDQDSFSRTCHNASIDILDWHNKQNKALQDKYNELKEVADEMAKALILCEDSVPNKESLLDEVVVKALTAYEKLTKPNQS